MTHCAIMLTVGDAVEVRAPNSVRPWRGRFVRWADARQSAIPATPGVDRYCFVQPTERNGFSAEPVELPARYVYRAEGGA